MISHRIRPYKGADENALIALWNQSMNLDTISPGVFRSKVLLDLNFDPKGLLVCQAGDRLLGFVLSIRRQVPLFTQGMEPDLGWITAFGVLPEFRRQGIGTRLFEAALGWLRQSGCKKVLVSPYTPNYFIPGVDVHGYPEALDFLVQLGWTTLYQPISMQANLNGFLLPPGIREVERKLLQEGISVRPVESRDIPDLFGFIQRHFGWDWVRFAQEYLSVLFGNHGEDIVFWIATQADDVLGYCQMRGERFGPFGVRPDMRSKGIGRVLLFRCLEAITSRGMHCAWFLWTSEDAARLYQLAGFEKARQFAVLEKIISCD